MRQAADLGLQREVVKIISESSEAIYSHNLDQQLQRMIHHHDPSRPLKSHMIHDVHASCAICSLTELECSEIRFQKAWIGYLWARACQCGVEPQVSYLKAERWAQALKQPPALQNFVDLSIAMKELCVLGIEQQIWLRR
ncbi:hypothetical protein CEUSTIGMA_g5173.t1 [Chlamydomonas eustigma]|uniref:Uncharacterized protein n=1 Tax=Chlamydomonas eustigma TaxID=1157962 RepID=A0A250X4P3_9CHLO|nr:hypothetical protein CEUSTIGMA_g5173.t1 [Chlamydomonas eustigma]|eukprot:GAX77730.1 hypothetical protein CEUSTIGMA_g5173.t1 [Chlamydomonas eustigma]